MIPGIIAAGFSVVMLFNFGALTYKTFYQDRIIQYCEEKKEFLIKDVAVRCEIIKDLR